jgi:hypothetical protein
MNRPELDEKLEQLHRELQQIESVDEEERKLLEQLKVDIEEIVKDEGGYQSERYKRVGEGLKESIEKLEARHPTATMVMGQTIEMLAKMGI